jgi:hypothetical protein
MPEGGETNIEIAHHLSEKEKHGEHELTRRAEILEVFEAVVLAMVAIATAWSGYQAARWDGQQSILYGRASKLRIEAQGTAAFATLDCPCIHSSTCPTVAHPHTTASVKRSPARWPGSLLLKDRRGPLTTADTRPCYPSFNLLPGSTRCLSLAPLKLSVHTSAG